MRLIIGLLALSLCSFSYALANDSDLSSGELNPDSYKFAFDFFKPDQVSSQAIGSNQFGIRLAIRKNGKLNYIPGMDFKLNLGRGSTVLSSDSGPQVLDYCENNPIGKIRGTAVLENKYFEVRDKETYELIFTSRCGYQATLIFEHDSFAGQAMGIWDVAMTAVNKFKKIDRIDFWKRKVEIKWPGRGDFYTRDTVNITRGDHWDIVGHEIGHALYDQAKIGRFGGGYHRIDECYTSTLALSEGWASFFGAWLKVDLDDPDARFEYLVPRRAPIRFENIPADVCRGETNEWRVTGFLWDLIDTHDDGESLEEAFSKLWDLTVNERFSKASQIKSKLLKSGFDPILLNIVWENNF